MKPLNYHHLLYFWTVVREGTVTAASHKLGLAQPTVSAQLRKLERSLGQTLFAQAGRRLELTEVGHTVYHYADDIFSAGEEMMNTLAGHGAERRPVLRVGVADVLPKMVVSRILHPVLGAAESVHLICFEGKPTELLERLAVHKLDLVLSDAPIGGGVNIRAFNHQLGECDVSIFAPQAIAKRYRDGFPKSLDGAPFFLPTANTSLRRELDAWFAVQEIRPFVLAEFEDSALLKAFTDTAQVLLPAPTVVAMDLKKVYGLEVVGRIESLRERFYAISLQRKVTHPQIKAIVTTAQNQYFV